MKYHQARSQRRRRHRITELHIQTLLTTRTTTLIQVIATRAARATQTVTPVVGNMIGISRATISKELMDMETSGEAMDHHTNQIPSIRVLYFLFDI